MVRPSLQLRAVQLPAVVLCLSLLSGCAAQATVESASQVSSASAGTVRDREAEVAAMRAELAAARIAAAKKEAELQELRQLVAQLRQENAEAHHSLLTVRRELEARQMDVERRQGEQAEAGQARNADAVTALERTVLALTAEVGQLKAQLGHVTAAQAVHDNVPAGSGQKKRLARHAHGETVPPATGAHATAGGLASAVPIVTPGRVPESLAQVTVQSGDTLWRIARRYHVSVTELRRANYLDGDVVQSGQLLTIPGPSQSGS